MAEQQTLADLAETLRAQLYGGSDVGDAAVGPWTMYQRAPRTPVLSDEEVPGAPLQTV
jgi:hypothetical protein